MNKTMEQRVYYQEYHRRNREQINQRRLTKVPCPECSKLITKCNMKAHLARPHNKQKKLFGTRWRNIIVPAVINVRSPVGPFPSQG